MIKRLFQLAIIVWAIFAIFSTPLMLLAFWQSDAPIAHDFWFYARAVGLFTAPLYFGLCAYFIRKEQSKRPLLAAAICLLPLSFPSTYMTSQLLGRLLEYPVIVGKLIAGVVGDAVEAKRMGPIKAGEKFRAEGDRARAIAAFTNAIKNNIEVDKAYLLRGLSYFELSKYDEALNDLGKVKNSENIVRAHAYAGLCRARLGHFDLAANEFQNAIQSGGGKDPFIWASLSLAQSHQDQLPAALQSAKKGLELSPRYPALLAAKAECERASGEYKEAIADATAAINQRGDCLYAYYVRGLALLAEKKDATDRRQQAAADLEYATRNPGAECPVTLLVLTDAERDTASAKYSQLGGQHLDIEDFPGGQPGVR